MKSKTSRASEPITCSICLERNSNSTLDNCSHLFCIRCIKKWSKKHNTCPLCRQQYRIITYKNKPIEVKVPERAQRRQPLQLTMPPPQRRIIFLPVSTPQGFPYTFQLSMIPPPPLQLALMHSFLFPPSPASLTFFQQVPVNSLNLNIS